LITPTSVSRSKQAARASYNRLSRWYDVLAGGSERLAAEHGWRQLKLGTGECVLELGPGTGRGLTAAAQAVGIAGRVVGLDLAEGMLRVARARLKAAGLAERVALHHGDAVRLPYPANIFDVIFMSFTLELFDTPDLGQVLGECRRVLRPGGRLGVVAMAQQDPPGLPVQLYLWAHTHWPTLVDCRPIPVRICLEATQFQIIAATRLSVWGLPVEAVTARRT
jgi:ubiquinone/menaquinone biosynthesis C-methylase UbiE